VNENPSVRARRKDVARLAGVSDAVVSYVLNNGPRPVASATRERVLKAITELNYRPNATARALRLQRTNVIGLLVPDISNPYFSEFAKVAQEACFSLGYALIVADSSIDEGREAAQVRALLERQVDGVIDYGVQDTALLSLLTTAGVPTVSMDSQMENPQVPKVAIDDYAASRDAVAHLVSHGHTRIGYIGGPRDVPVSRARWRGWRDVMTESAPEVKVDELVINPPFSRAGGAAGAADLLSRPSPPTALFIASDLQAMGSLYACSVMGLSVPDDVAIISFDGTQETEYSVPPLTVVKQPVDELARTAVARVLDNDPSAGPTRTVIAHSLVLRRSCGCEAPA
jgi:LacI family transcriptional regulator